MDTEKNSFLLMGIVAIVAIVGIVLMVTVGGMGKARMQYAPVMDRIGAQDVAIAQETDAAGQPIRRAITPAGSAPTTVPAPRRTLIAVDPVGETCAGTWWYSNDGTRYCGSNPTTGSGNSGGGTGSPGGTIGSGPTSGPQCCPAGFVCPSGSACSCTCPRP